MPNLAGLSQLTTGATALSNLIMAIPQHPGEIQAQMPFNQMGPPPPAFLFDFEGDQSVSLKSDIPEHYLETNTPVQDQIANKPETYTTGGFVSELNDIPPGFLKILKNIADKAQIIGAYAPQATIAAQTIYAQAFFLYSVAENAANAAVSAWGTVNSWVTGTPTTPPQNKQQVAFQKLYGYWAAKTLFTVTTPWMQMRDMAIGELKVTSDEETRVISSFAITFVKLRFATTTFSASINQAGDPALIPNNFQGHTAAQAAPMVNQGATVPTASPTSFLSKFGLG